MRRWSLPLLAVLALLSPIAAHAQDPAGVAWRTDLTQARAEAEAAGKPLLVWFR